ncbi:MAG TPA: SIS domain-containing protein [Chloroflexota bacterium]|nr:SIS domain-containing protein [Chloroflexota bacterium]
MTTDFIADYLDEVRWIADHLDRRRIQQLVELLADVRASGGRLFIIGVGGSAGNASHAVNDFRKLAGFEAYAPTDNVSELTARINDEGWDTCLANWLTASRLHSRDALCVLSVGGGDVERGVSVSLVRAIDLARGVGARVCGIVGRDGGYTAQAADVCLIVPPLRPSTITAHAESFQAVIWHLVVCHPLLKIAETKWEQLEK